jgi:hypothetical protein
MQKMELNKQQYSIAYIKAEDRKKQPLSVRKQFTEC